MTPARVRGCAESQPARQADASRRRNGPRKATSRRPITVRIRGKTCPAGGSDVLRTGRRAVVARALRDPQQADVGTKTRSAGRVFPLCHVRHGDRVLGTGSVEPGGPVPGALEYREEGVPKWTSS